VAERVTGEIPVRFRYTPGAGNEAFFVALRDRGVLLGSRCDGCGVTFLPARIFCERCLAQLEPNFECGPEGTVESFTVAHEDVDGTRLSDPVTYALVRLDGADTVLLHRLLEPAAIGDRVRVVMVADRTGSMQDIRGFTPAPT
jgi:hypothetical protein